MPSYEYLNDFSVQAEEYWEPGLVLRHSVCGQDLLPAEPQPHGGTQEDSIPISVALLRISLHTCPGRK
jgi:hypothetical protein